MSGVISSPTGIVPERHNYRLSGHDEHQIHIGNGSPDPDEVSRRPIPETVYAVDESDPDEDQTEQDRVEATSGLDHCLRRVDGRPHQYSVVGCNSPVLWRSQSPALLFKGITISIVVTMYNESSDDLLLTLRGICKCVKFMCKKTGDPELWRRISVTIVVDGREKLSDSVQESCRLLNMTDPLTMEKLAKSNPNIALHLFECAPSFADEGDKTAYPPIQIIWAIKEQNCGKINSHWWYFEGIAHIQAPKYCFLVDIGTKPRRSSFYWFWRHLTMDESVGGVCGQITTIDKGLSLCNPIIGSQHFEYKVASVLDKSFESVLGYMAVLPGAFSAYRYSAIIGQPLRAYFHQLFVSDVDLDPFVTNMMLAEDRVLCYELIAKKNACHVLHYLNSAIAETDVPDTLGKLIKQRRRWLNGSFFALIHTLRHYNSFYNQTSHRPLRKAAITFEFIYFTIAVIVQWFTIGLFGLINVFVLSEFKVNPVYIYIISGIYIGFVLGQIVLAIKNDPIGLSTWYSLSSFSIGACFIALSILTICLSWSQIRSADPLVLVTLFLSFGTYLLAALLHGSLSTLITSFIAYIYMMPTFLIILPIFAFTNVNDVSWGTKNLNTAAFENQNTTESVRSQVAMRFHLFRLKLLFLWLSSNVIPILITRSGTILTCLIPIELLFLVICQVGIAVLSVYYQIGHIFLYLILAVLVFLNGSRFIGSLVYLFGHNASPSMMVKMILAPIRPNVWLSLVKLPFSVIISSIGLIVVMFSFFCPISPLLSGLARLDIWFSHLGTSSSKYAVKTFIPTATLQRYFGTIRLMITLSAFIVIALITLMIVSMNRSLAPWNFCPSALPWCNPDINLPSKWTIISILILLGCNIGYGAEFATRRVLQKIACQS